MKIRYTGERGALQTDLVGGPVAPRTLRNRLKFLLPTPPVTVVDKLGMADNMATILDVGLSAFDCLDILQEETKNTRMKEIYGGLKERVRAGMSLSQSLEAYSDVFAMDFINLIKVGEAGGVLADTLRRLAAKLNREFELRSKVIGAMLYPCIVLASIVVIGVVMMIYVMPRIVQIFKESAVTLPPQTVALIAVSEFMSAHRLAIAVVALLLVAGFALSFRSPRIVAVYDRIVLRLPYFGPLARNYELVRFAENMRLLQAGGMPLVEAFVLIGNTAGNAVYRDRFRLMADEIARGVPVSEALRGTKALFPSMFTRMVSVGEHTGSLQEVFGKLSAFYGAKVESSLQNMGAVLAPVLMIVVGLIVGALALSIMLPLYELSWNF